MNNYIIILLLILSILFVGMIIIIIMNRIDHFKSKELFDNFIDKLNNKINSWFDY